MAKIIAIDDDYEDDTYDIWNRDHCLDNNGNFFINGLMVHNSILVNGVRNFSDLVLLGACGHPGPMSIIPEIVANRDDKKQLWKLKLHPDALEILKNTYGHCVYQEQLAALFQKFAGFSSTEAQEARKAVAKKWIEKLKPIKEKWLVGASKTMGVEAAEEAWARYSAFGRYAFNLSHGISYYLMSYRCLWLKRHFAPEYWAAVMSSCHPDKLPKFMEVARTEGWAPTNITSSGSYKSDDNIDNIKLGTINIDRLTINYTVTGDIINPGLIGIKGIGENVAKKLIGNNKFRSIEEFLEHDHSKIVIERFIKIGAFAHLPNCQNMRALWIWYQYTYCNGKECEMTYEIAHNKPKQSAESITRSLGKAIKKLEKSLENTEITDDQKDELKTQLRDIKKQYSKLVISKDNIDNKLLEQQGWTKQKIITNRDQQILAYKTAYPKRKKIPDKLLKWEPKPSTTLTDFMQLFPDDFSFQEALKFELTYLGYYIHSPLDEFIHDRTHTIANAKGQTEVELEGIITNVAHGKTKTNNDFFKLTILDAMLQSALVFIWSNEIRGGVAKVLERAVNSFSSEESNSGRIAVQLIVDYDEKRGSFSLSRGHAIVTLARVKDNKSSKSIDE